MANEPRWSCLRCGSTINQCKGGNDHLCNPCNAAWAARSRLRRKLGMADARIERRPVSQEPPKEETDGE